MVSASLPQSLFRPRSLAAVLLSAAVSLPATAQGLDWSDVFLAEAPRSAAWSPDGRHLAVSIAGRGAARVDLVEVSTGARRPLGEGREPVWAPDGRRLAVLRGRDIWVLDVTTGGATQLTADAADERALAWSPDGAHLAFMSGRSGAQDVWVVSATGGAPRALTDKAMHLDTTRFGLAWSPDSRSVAYVSNAGGWPHDELWVVGLDGRAPRQMSRGVNVTSRLDWSPDSGAVAFSGLSHDIYRYGDMVDLYVARPDGGARRVTSQVFAADRGGSGQVRWSPDGRHLLFTVLDRGDTNIWSVPAQGGVATQVTFVEGDIADFSVNARGLAFVLSTPTERGAVQTLPWSGGTPATVVPGHAPTGLRPPQRVAYRAQDGLFVPGFLFLPPGFNPAERHPALVQVHGGGHNAYTNGFNGVEHVLASRGYVVLAINYRGSSAHGREFQDLAIEDWGGQQALDAAAAADFLRQQPWSNGRVGIYGGSYGGIITLAAITHAPDAFDAAVPMRGIYDFAAAWEEADRIGRIFTERGHRGTPAQNPDAYRRSSSLARVERIRIPLLVMHGGRDVRAPARQHQMLTERLRAAGKPFEEQIYPDEAHGFSVSSQVDMYSRLLTFFDRHLRSPR